MGLDTWMVDDLLEIILVFVEWHMLLIWRVWQRRIVGSEEDGLINQSNSYPIQARLPRSGS